VGTDILFGLVLAVLGSAFHWRFGSINGRLLTELLEGGVPGVIIGCVSARYLPARKLKLAIAVIAIFAGLQLVWSGSRSLMARHSQNGGGLRSNEQAGRATRWQVESRRFLSSIGNQV
jgi:uncharacterized membrane protein YfcA